MQFGPLCTILLLSWRPMFPKDSDMQNLYHDHKTDPLERKIRFGCGFTFGLIIGFFGFAKIMYASPGLVVASAVIAALVCGWLALKYGDRFWHQMIQRWRWWT
jgi:hypothetical protein